MIQRLMHKAANHTHIAHNPNLLLSQNPMLHFLVLVHGIRDMATSEGEIYDNKMTNSFKYLSVEQRVVRTSI
jgi:hypothetical protein